MKWIVHQSGEKSLRWEQRADEKQSGLVCEAATRLSSSKASGFADRARVILPKESPDPFQQIRSRAVHELIFDDQLDRPPAYLALRAAREAMQNAARPNAAVVWCELQALLYPPALVLAGFSLERLCIIRPDAPRLIATVAECLRCPGVGAVIAAVPANLSRVQARRLQLAAERGGNVGLLLRPKNRGKNADVYAAATRWIVSALPGSLGVQRWKVEQIHGQGRQFDRSFVVENRRAPAAEFDLPGIAASFGFAESGESFPVHSPSALADRAAAAARAGATTPRETIGGAIRNTIAVAADHDRRARSPAIGDRRSIA